MAADAARLDSAKTAQGQSFTITARGGQVMITGRR
jgi:hypothetical protein